MTYRSGIEVDVTLCRRLSAGIRLIRVNSMLLLLRVRVSYYSRLTGFDALLIDRVIYY